MGISRINKPYCLDKDDWAAINRYFLGNHERWSNKNFDPFKKKVKKYLRVQQNNRCCYCKKFLKYDKKEVDIEHIIPKSERPFFTFLNYNLALSCPACNTTKNFDFPLVVNTKRTFGFSSADYLLVHPHFDEYFQHIEIIDGILFRSKTPKGDWVIEHCELNSLDKVKDKILDLKLLDKADNNKINSLLTGLITKVAAPETLAILLELIDDIKNKRFVLP